MSSKKIEPILFITTLNGSRFNIKILKGQNVESNLSADIDVIKITGPIPMLTKFAVQSLFVATDYSLTDGLHIHISKYVPIAGLEDALLEGLEVDSKGQLTAESISIIEHLAAASIELEEFTEDRFTKIVAQIEKKFSYKFDFEAFKEKLEKERGVVINIKKEISKKYPIPKEEDCGFYVNPDVWQLLVRNVLRGENTLITGATGSGKTEVVALVAKAMGLDLNIQDMGTVQDAQSALLGVHRLNDQGNSVFDPAPFVQHVQQKGIVLLDEMNRKN